MIPKIERFAGFFLNLANFFAASRPPAAKRAAFDPGHCTPCAIVRRYLARPKLHSGPVFTAADYAYLVVFASALGALWWAR